jgi:hypothetical protein
MLTYLSCWNYIRFHQSKEYQKHLDKKYNRQPKKEKPYKSSFAEWSKLFPLLLMLFIGCDDIGSDELSPITFELDARLPVDQNGYYHLEIDTMRWQTIHRLSGHLYRNGIGMNVTKMGWGSSHYWIIGDTFGYVVRYGLTDDLVYMSYDTTYVDWFDGMAVPIVNGSSYSREDGEVNTMIAPVRIMRYDTITIFTAWWDEWRTEQTEGDPIYIVLD